MLTLAISPSAAPHTEREPGTLIFFIFLRLGLTSFGGPIAHIGYFHDEFVKRRRWLDERSYSDLVALCQFLPGPASSQVGIAIGLQRAGVAGAIAAWTGFTLPSALLLVAFGYGIAAFHGPIGAGILHGFKLVAVPIVAQALWSMGTKFCADRISVIIAIVGAALAATLPFGFGQVSVIILGGIAGRFLMQDSLSLPHVPIKIGFSRRAGAVLLATLAAILLLLPVAAHFSDSQSVRLFDSFFRAGSLVFGGGHVVLPLLKSEVVGPGWVSADSFMAGYGAAQAIPGPLFTFSAYLGSVSTVPPSGVIGALICLIAAFLPSFFLVFGTLPFWEQIRKYEGMRTAMQGINAAVVGLLLSAFYNPVWTSAIFSPRDFGLALLGFLLLVFVKVPSWAIVLLSAAVGAFL